MTLEGGATRIPVLIDTDAGTNFDDALALAYLARQPRCEIVGITTVTGDTQARARVVDAILSAAGRSDAPIVAGCGDPISGPGQPETPHHDSVHELAEHRTFDDDMVGFLSRTLEARKGEITVLTLGPLTNYARLLEAEPRALDWAHAVVSMLGSWDRGGPETNAASDPAAARRVLAARHRGHRFVGLDATGEVRIDQDRARHILERPEYEPVLRMQGRWITDARELPCHDAIAAASVFAPDLCSWIGGDADINDFGKTSRMATNGPFAFATAVAGERFLRHFAEILSP